MGVQKWFQEYVGELHEHLFENEPIDRIIKKMDKSHRRKRFLSMYLIQSPEIFNHYYKEKKEFELEELFNQVISGLLYNLEENRLKQFFVDLLSLNQDMVTNEVSDFEIKEFEKDLYAFSFHEIKKTLKKDVY